MEYLVMECGLSYAVVLDQDGRILKVPNLGYTVGQSLKDVVLLPERPVRQQVLHKRIARWSALAACLCLLLLGSWVWQSPIGTVRMQINPDVLLSVNRFDRVVALEGLNEDGTALIDGYRAYGQEMKTVSDELRHGVGLSFCRRADHADGGFGKGRLENRGGGAATSGAGGSL